MRADCSQVDRGVTEILIVPQQCTSIHNYQFAVNHMSIRDDFIAAIRNCPDLPHAVRAAAATVQSLEETCFDSTYLDFLDEQIELNARGDEWSERLCRRRTVLTEWCDRPLLTGIILAGPNGYWIKVDRETQSVVYWEEYPRWYESNGQS